MIRTLVTAPTVEPVSLEDAKAHLRVDSGAHDARVTLLLQAARERVETMTRRQLMLATWEVQFDAFPGRRIVLPRAPLLTVTSVKYLDEDLVEQTVSASLYRTITYAGPTCRRGVVELKTDESWPDGVYVGSGAVRIRYTAGYSSSVDVRTARAAVPAALRAAVLTTLEESFDRGGDTMVGASVAELSLTTRRLCLPFILPADL